MVPGMVRRPHFRPGFRDNCSKVAASLSYPSERDLILPGNCLENTGHPIPSSIPPPGQALNAAEESTHIHPQAPRDGNDRRQWRGARFLSWAAPRKFGESHARSAGFSTASCASMRRLRTVVSPKPTGPDLNRTVLSDPTLKGLTSN